MIGNPLNSSLKKIKEKRTLENVSRQLVYYMA